LPADEPLRTVAEVATVLHVSRSFVYQACAARTMLHVRIGAALRFEPAPSGRRCEATATGQRW
jgi:excisionase family DNA binding protein